MKFQEEAVKFLSSLSVQELFEGEHAFSDFVDTRSPSEFAQDHIPGAISCPVLSDRERAEVGTLYKQQSVFEAKKLGAALVARNIAQHLQATFVGHDIHWRPMVYCWRGGTRSGAMNHILREVGWKSAQLEGGYKAYRKYVLQQLEILPKQFDFHVVCGETGSAKSRLLETLASHGEQVLDLEGLASHKGSVLGGLPDNPQPSQKMFESLVWDALRKMNPDKPVYIEAESKKIGQLRTPEFLFERMTQSTNLIRVEVDVTARVEFLLRDYAYFLEDPDALKSKLGYLKSLHGWTVINEWFDLIDQEDWQSLVAQLLIRHYDPAYRKSMGATYPLLDDAYPLTAKTLTQDTFEEWVKQLQAVSEVS